MKNAIDSSYFRKARVASKYKLSAPWVRGSVAPTQPTRMLSNVTVYDGWECTSNARLARGIVEVEPQLTLRDLQARMLKEVELGNTSYPYVWWIYEQTCRTRAIHEDSDGRPFVKLHNKWHLAYPIDAIAGLVGAQGVLDYERVPKTGFFILWENEDIARNHSA